MVSCEVGQYLLLMLEVFCNYWYFVGGVFVILGIFCGELGSRSGDREQLMMADTQLSPHISPTNLKKPP